MLESVKLTPQPGHPVKFSVKLNAPLGSEPIYLWLTNKIEVMVFRDGENVRAISSLCPHMGARLQWDRNGSRVKCPWHGLSYDGNGLKSCHHRYKKLTEYKAQLLGDELIIHE